MEAYRRHVDAHFEAYLQELRGYLRQPSIAATGEGMAEGAELTLQLLRGLGAEARRIPVEGAPDVVYGQVGQGERTLLVYNHYDVQPPEPLELWESPPFEPQVRDGHLYARGVSDDKGHLMVRIQALRAYQEAVGPLPLRVRFVVEGEEEVGSPHLEAFAQANADLLRADGCLWEFGYKDLSERPILFLGVKGIVYTEFEARGAARDLHSMWGTIVPNPAWRLVWALESLKGPGEELRLDGLAAHVAPVPPEDEPLLEVIPFDADGLRRDFEVDRFAVQGEEADLLRAHLYRPTITICGFGSGYTGQGVKTVLPSRAVAKVDFRLVPDLSPELVLELVRKHLDRRGFQDVEVRRLAAEPPAKSPVTSAVAQAAIEATRLTSTHPPVVYPLLAGSGPMYHLCQALGTPAVSAGISHSRSNEHAPNENIRLEDYREGLYWMGEFVRLFSRKA